jgi:hypothetical protein
MGRTSMVDYVTYANQGATRSQPLSEDMVRALSFLPELGLGMEVFSGGQPAEGGGPRVGSTRHDHGGAGDVFFTRNGERLDWRNPDDVPIFQEIVRRGKANGLTGFGAGDNYMQPGSMHVGFGDAAVWGEGGRGANAPDWLNAAYYGDGTYSPPAGNALTSPSGEQQPQQRQDAPQNALERPQMASMQADPRAFMTQRMNALDTSGFNVGNPQRARA